MIFCVLWLGCGKSMPPENVRVYQGMQDKANELGAMHTKVDLDSSHAIEGKTAIVVHWGYSPIERPDDFRVEGFTQYFDGIAKAKVLDLWGLKPDAIATDPSDIETVVRVGCTSGARIPDFQADGRDRPVPAYAKECLVELIDYQSATVFAQGFFRNSTIEPTRRVLPIDTKVVASPPYDEIMNYVRNYKHN